MADQHLIVSFLSESQSDLMTQLAFLIETHECELVQTRCTKLKHHEVGFLHISGSWVTLAKMEKELQLLSASCPGLDYARTEVPHYPAPMITYSVQVIGIQRPYTLHRLIQFFASQELTLTEISSHQYHTMHTRTAMLSIQGVVLVPADHSLSILREAFILFCEDNNLDALFEPERS